MPGTKPQRGSITWLGRLLPALLLSLSVTGIVWGQESSTPVDEALEVQATSDSEAQQSQQEVDELADEITASIAENRRLTQRINRLRIYNQNLSTLVADQESQKQSLQQEIDGFGAIEQGVVPLMTEMIATLRRFVDLDMPFLQKERFDRLARLDSNMARSDLTVSEKYRQIVEAYQIEVSYGRNIEAYIGTLAIDGVERKVDLLRVGRVVLAYQTLDRSESGFWDKTSGQWTALDDSYRREIADGLRIARRQMAPRLLELPIPAAGAGQ